MKRLMYQTSLRTLVLSAAFLAGCGPALNSNNPLSNNPNNPYYNPTTGQACVPVQNGISFSGSVSKVYIAQYGMSFIQAQTGQAGIAQPNPVPNPIPGQQFNGGAINVLSLGGGAFGIGGGGYPAMDQYSSSTLTLNLMSTGGGFNGGGSDIAQIQGSLILDPRYYYNSYGYYGGGYTGLPGYSTGTPTTGVPGGTTAYQQPCVQSIMMQAYVDENHPRYVALRLVLNNGQQINLMLYGRY